MKLLKDMKWKVLKETVGGRSMEVHSLSMATWRYLTLSGKMIMLLENEKRK